MPEMDGWEVAQRLRQSSPERTAIVVLSANAIDPGRLVNAERLHDEYLMKPIDLRQLLKTIHVLLNIEWIYEPGGTEPQPARCRSRRVQSGFRRASDRRADRSRRDRPRAQNSRKTAPSIEHELAGIRAISSVKCAPFVNAFDLKRYLAALEGTSAAAMRKKESRDIVLVVDDSPDTLRMLTDAIEDAGMTVLVAREGEHAISIVERVTPDVILMDARDAGHRRLRDLPPPEAERSRWRMCRSSS